MDIEQRLSALEALNKAAPAAVSVDTLLERVKLGKEATAELSRTLKSWSRHEESDGRPPRFFRYCHRDSGASLYVPQGIRGETRYHLTCEADGQKLAIRIECDPTDTARVLQLADVALAIGGFRLESAVPA